MLLIRRQISGFPSKHHPQRCRLRDRIATESVLQSTHIRQSRRFPQQYCPSLSSFASQVSYSDWHQPPGRSALHHCSVLPPHHSRQATPTSGHNTRTDVRPYPPDFRFVSSGRKEFLRKPPRQEGFSPICHYGSPSLSFSLKMPPTGRRQQKQGASSMCPLTDF